MKLERLENIEEQLSSMEEAFDDLRDNVHWIRKDLQEEIKELKENKPLKRSLTKRWKL